MKTTVRLAAAAAALAAATFAAAHLRSNDGFAFSQEQPSQSVDVGKALDQLLPPRTFNDRTIDGVLAELAKLSGVPISLEDKTADLLPWGRETRLKDVKVPKDARLRDVLDQLLAALGLRYEIRDDRIEVVWTEPLRRINRRATWNDLALLAKLRELDGTWENLAEFKMEYRLSSQIDAPATLAEQFKKAGRGSLAEVLEVATASHGWVWFPYDDRLVVMTNQAQMAHRLAKRVTCRYNNEPLAHILFDLANKADIVLSLEPGMMLALPPSTAQSYTLSLQNSSMRQALEVICAETGLFYEMRRDGLFVGLADRPQDGDTGGTGRRSPYVGKISIPSADGSYFFEFLLREDELPADLLEYRRQVIEDYIEKMRRDLEQR